MRAAHVVIDGNALKPCDQAALTAVTVSDKMPTMKLRVREIRIEKQLTQEQVVDNCSFGRSYLSQIEAGQANPTLTVLEELASALDVELTDLLEK